MNWNSLISRHNLELAWRRINTGRNFAHKRFFRDAYLTYELGLDSHIAALNEELRSGVWRASQGDRVYVPKPSGLQRPLTYLGIEDQIVYQAVANRVAKKLEAKRRSVEMECVFSNVLHSERDSIFFTEQWQVAYHEYCERCKVQFDVGRRWAAFFDLAAYYDTISHDLLIKTIVPRGGHDHTMSKVKAWLKTWGVKGQVLDKSHGLPQGQIASDFLAEIFFLPIDKIMRSENIGYFRYVDDIRLYGYTENEVRRAAIKLEQLCRDYGLIPQSSKFGIKRLGNRDEALGKLPSIPPQSSRVETRVQLPALWCREILASCISGKPEEVSDKSRFRYVLYRAPKDDHILRKVIRLLPRHPEHIDAFVFYFGNYDKKLLLVRKLIAVLEEGMPYSYVRGELWHVVARLSNRECLIQALPLAIRDAQSRKNCVALSWGVMHFLIRCSNDGVHFMGRRLEAEASLSRALLCQIFPKAMITPRLAGLMFKGSLEEQLAISRAMQQHELRLGNLALTQRNCKSHSKIALKSCGVIERRFQPGRDWIAETLSKKYHCSGVNIWRNLLGAEYAHALQILIEAEACYDPMRSAWLSLQDSFNDIVVRKFVEFSNINSLTSRQIALTRPNGRSIDIGVILQVNGLLERAHPTMTLFMREIHQRRNQLPGSHPYDSRTGGRSTFLKKAEQRTLQAKLCAVYQHLVQYVYTNT